MEERTVTTGRHYLADREQRRWYTWLENTEFDDERRSTRGLLLRRGVSSSQCISAEQPRVRRGRGRRDAARR